MRTLLALAAAAVTGLAAIVSALDGDTDELWFFGVLTAFGLGTALAVSPLVEARLPARLLAILWAGVGLWIGGLLVMYQGACGCTMPPPAPEALYLGLTATAWHLVGMYLSTALVLVAAFGRSSFLDRPVGRIGRIEHSG